MNNEEKLVEFREWVAALRSGEFKQGTNYLAYTFGEDEILYCCLGVKCELDVRANRREIKKQVPHEYDTVIQYGDIEMGDIVLPEITAQELGIGTEGVVIVDDLSPETRAKIGTYNLRLEDPDQIFLSTLNDYGVPFAVIADVIEELWINPLEALSGVS